MTYPAPDTTEQPPVVSPVAVLAEYGSVKHEQNDRIGRRNNLIYATIGVIGVVGWVAISHNMPKLLLVLPFACFALGWTYLSDDLMTSAIGRYAEHNLAPRLAAATGDPEALAWERDRPGDIYRNQRKWIQLGVDLALFALPGYAVAIMLARPGLPAAYSYGVWTYLLMAVAVLSSSLLAGQFIRYSDVRAPRLLRRGRWGR